ncbi:UDP-N-acetyl-D-mannosamine dehydrogenase [Vitreimonas sp.]|uniref:UDP-N-acetyl-D-mannosamine dehydrogenase n=1 Tax=Vitreimonas sp. TaxID=3069702 RepID=UPI002ED9C035
MTQPYSTVSVIGLGYVGLPTAATLAAAGVNVIGVDKSSAVIDRINQGLTHIIEPDLDAVVQRVVRDGKLRATHHPEPAEAFLIAVPTPIREDNSPDMAMVESAVNSIAPVLKKGDLVIIESTSPVGTTERAEAALSHARPDLRFPSDHPNASDILMAYCPERVLPGRTLTELVENARLVGGLDETSAAAAKRLYRIFAKGDIRETHARVAEMSKLSENAFRDVNVAFANELSLACDALNVDVWQVIELANLHPRVNILLPGAGVGGHCIPIDPWFIHHAAPQCTPLIRTAREVNLGKTDWVVQQIRRNAGLYTTPRVALLGLSYKPDIDDLRESPAMHVAQAIAGQDWLNELNIVEPHIEELPPALQGRNNVRLLPLEDAIANSDVVTLLVSHNAFRDLNRTILAGKSIIDTSGVLRAA